MRLTLYYAQILDNKLSMELWLVLQDFLSDKSKKKCAISLSMF